MYHLIGKTITVTNPCLDSGSLSQMNFTSKTEFHVVNVYKAPEGCKQPPERCFVLKVTSGYLRFVLTIRGDEVASCKDGTNIIIDKQISYLAGPYSHPDSSVRELRYAMLTELTAMLMKQGKFIFSPITHCHVAANQYGLPTDWNYWKDYNKAFLNMSKELIIYNIPGWETSVGVQAEIEYAKELNIPIHYLKLQ